MAPNEEAATTSTRRYLTSPVWGSFQLNRPDAAGGPATATCGECGQTLRAGGSIGTSHLHRHTKSKRCQQRAAERRKLTPPNSAAEAPPPGDDQEEEHCSTPPPVYAEEEELFVVDGIDIPGLFDDLMDKNLVNIDVSPLPQATRYSTKWYLQKKKERKGAENKKRCAPEDESGLDLSSRTDSSSSSEKRMFSAGATYGDNARQFSRASNI